MRDKMVLVFVLITAFLCVGVIPASISIFILGVLYVAMAIYFYGLLENIKSLSRTNDDIADFANELLRENTELKKNQTDPKGARLAIDNSKVVSYANAWLTNMPDDTARDFVVKFDGWDENDWTMWVRMPWGKYKSHKAEVDFAVGRNVVKDAVKKKGDAL